MTQDVGRSSGVGLSTPELLPTHAHILHHQENPTTVRKCYTLERFLGCLGTLSEKWGI